MAEERQEKVSLDKIVINHLDQMDDIKARIDKDVDKMMKGIDIDLIIDDPEHELMKFVSDINQILITQYYAEAAKNGIEFAQRVKKDGMIEIPKSKDPQLNKELETQGIKGEQSR